MVEAFWKCTAGGFSFLICAACAALRQEQPYECRAFPSRAASPYVLPYAVGASARVMRTFTHYRPGNGGVGLYAIDFAMRIGTPLHAARAGTVVAVEERYADDNGQDLKENFVFVEHDDDSVARYMHLTRGGAVVRLGDTVKQGALIGYSGNSGQSTTPHLHFDVQQCGPNLPPNYNRLPCGQTLPVSFRNTRRHNCGLTPNRSYAAMPFRPQERSGGTR